MGKIEDSAQMPEEVLTGIIGAITRNRVAENRLTGRKPRAEQGGLTETERRKAKGKLAEAEYRKVEDRMTDMT